MSAKESNPFLIPIAIILAGLIIGGSNLLKDYLPGANRQASSPTTQPSVETPGEQPTPAPDKSKTPGALTVKVAVDDDPALGSSDAPVTLIEFSDYQCPFCGAWWGNEETIKKLAEGKIQIDPSLPQLKSEYIETGKVRFVYRDYAFLGDESQWAAEAAECADEQGKFWVYHDELFRRQKGENEGTFSLENLKKIATDLKLDTVRFNACLKSRQYEAEVKKDLEDGQAIAKQIGRPGLGTPTILVNGRFISGAIPYPQLKAIIEAELAQAQK